MVPSLHPVSVIYFGVLLTIAALTFVIQLGAAVLALRLIKTTGQSKAWVLLSAGLVVLAVRDVVSLVDVDLQLDGGLHDLIAQLLGLVLAILIYLGVSRIEPLFTSIVEHRRKAEESESRYRLLSDASMEAVTVRDGHRLVDANAAFVRMFGYEMNEALDLGFLETVADSEREWVAKRVEAGDERYSYTEVLMQRKDGTTFPAEVNVRIQERQGKTVRVATVLDLTGRKALEAQVRRYDRLAAQGQLTSGIAHDFNNILTVILSTAAVLEVDHPSDSVRAGLREIQASAKRGAAMVSKLLGFSREGSLTRIPVDLKETVRETHAMLVRLLPAGIALELTFDDGPALAVADAGAVEQMILDLATNAKDAMPDGGMLHIHVGARSPNRKADPDGDISGPFTCIEVRDTGAGMDEETASHAFEPFFTTKEPGKGTGLGLAMVYGLMKQHGGSAEVLSDPGEGTTVRLYLPSFSGELAPEQGEPVQASPEEAATVLSRG